MCGYDGVQRENYLRGEPIRKIEVEKNGKAAGKDKVTEEMVKAGGDMVLDWIWKLCNMAFESDVPEDWRSAVIVPHCTRVKERGLNFRTIEVLAC